jgi:NitT/TauT family transport system ATP-binding protein
MISLRNVAKTYVSAHGQTIALENVDLEFARESITGIFGANGSGKSTLLNIVAGLLEPSTGAVIINGKPPRVGYVLQDFRNSLLPWRTLSGNVALPCVWHGTERAALDQRLQMLLTTFGVRLPLKRYPHEVSGGQAQMACLLRALLYNPDLLILDEPASALDYTLQWQTIMELQTFCTIKPVTVVLASHDLEQQLMLADRIVVLESNPGRVAETIEITLPRPRTLETTTTKAFLDLKHHVLSRFTKRQTQCVAIQ